MSEKTIGDILAEKLTRHPEFYEMLELEKRMESAFFLWYAGKYFDKPTRQIKDLRFGSKYKIDDDGYVMEVGDAPKK